MQFEELDEWVWNGLSKSAVYQPSDERPNSEEMAEGLHRVFHLLCQMADRLNTEFDTPHGPKFADLTLSQIFLANAANHICPGYGLEQIDLTQMS